MAKEIVLRNVRLSYVHLTTPTSFDSVNRKFIEDTEAGNYTAVILIPKGSEAEAILQDTIKELKNEAVTSGIRSQGKTHKLTDKDLLRYNDAIKDGNAKDAAEYEDVIYITGKSKAEYPPKVYDQKNVPSPASIIYSGCYANVAINVYNYMAASNIGCSYGLRAVQFAKDGEKLGGASQDTDSIFGDKHIANDNMFT